MDADLILMTTRSTALALGLEKIHYAESHEGHQAATGLDQEAD